MEIKTARKKQFTKQLLHWHETENERSLPWKGEKDPYRIWLSEIILQQTRAEQGLPYYLKFIRKYPDVKKLAKAKDEEVFRLWQGLGYYNRCRNMLATARYITNELLGHFPKRFEDLLQLKGVGHYTAAAIASFAFDLPHAVVDSNVYRVLARYFGIDEPIDSTEGKKLFHKLACELLDAGNSALYNQAIMDMGATLCVPKKPNCSECSFRKNCAANELGLVETLPVKSKKQKVVTRHFYYILFVSGKSVWIRKRVAKDIWQDLHEPYLVESIKPLKTSIVKTKLPVKLVYDMIHMGAYKQRLSHQIIESTFYKIALDSKINFNIDGQWVRINELEKFAFPKTIISFLEKKLYF